MTNLSLELSIVIVTYRSLDKLRHCLDSLLPNNHSGVQFEVIIINNDPTDADFQALSEEYTSYKFLNNSDNHGFAHGCNTGALQASAPTILFLNPDTAVPASSLRKMLDCYTQLPGFSILGTQKATASGRLERIERYFPSLLTVTGVGKSLHRLMNRKRLKQDFSRDKETVTPDWVSGSVLMIAKDALMQLNGWETRFWMYSEDVDLCWRATKKGGQVRILNSVTIEHLHGGSSRLNPEITALTKTESKISHHVFTSLHFTGWMKYAMHAQFALIHILPALFWALISLLFFNHPKAISKRCLLKNLLSYYGNRFTSNNWQSKRSVGIEQRFKPSQD